MQCSARSRKFHDCQRPPRPAKQKYKSSTDGGWSPQTERRIVAPREWPLAPRRADAEDGSSPPESGASTSTPRVPPHPDTRHPPILDRHTVHAEPTTGRPHTPRPSAPAAGAASRWPRTARGGRTSPASPRAARPAPRRPIRGGVRGRRLRATTTTKGTTIPPPDRPRGPRTRRRTATSRRRPSGRKARCSRPPPPPPRRPRRRARREEARSARPRRASGATGSRAGRDRQTPPTTTGRPPWTWSRRTTGSSASSPRRTARSTRSRWRTPRDGFTVTGPAGGARPGLGGIHQGPAAATGAPRVVLMLEDAPAVAAAGAACAREVMRAMRGVGCFALVARRLPRHRVFPVPPNRPGGRSDWRKRSCEVGAIGFHPDHHAAGGARVELRRAVDVAPDSDASNSGTVRDNGVRRGVKPAPARLGRGAVEVVARGDGTRPRHTRCTESGPERDGCTRGPRLCPRVPGAPSAIGMACTACGPSGVSTKKRATTSAGRSGAVDPPVVRAVLRDVVLQVAGPSA